MAVELRLKRRAAGGAAGAPASLKSAEPAFNEQDDTLYYGKGDNGSGVATSVVPIAGKGAFVDKTSPQTVAGVKTFSDSPVVPTPTTDMQAATKKYVDDSMSGAGLGDMLKSVYDTDNDGKVNAAVAADSVPWSGVSSKVDATTSVSGLMSASDKTKLDGVATNANNYTHPSGDGNRHVPATGTGNNGKFLKSGATAASESWESVTKSDVGLGNVDNTSDANKPVSTAQQTALDLKANASNATLTGTPTAPTASVGTNTTQIANTAFVAAAIAALIDGAPGAIDTLNELAAALGDDPNFATTVTNALAGKLAKSANLSDLTDVGAARTALELASMSLQASSSVSITGGSISGITLDGGTF